MNDTHPTIKTADDALHRYQTVTLPEKMAASIRKDEEERQRRLEIERNNAAKAEQDAQSEKAFQDHYKAQLDILQPARQVFDHMVTSVTHDEASQQILLKKIEESGATTIPLFFQRPWMVGGYSSVILTPEGYNRYTKMDGTFGHFEEMDIDTQFYHLANDRNERSECPKKIENGPFQGWKIYVKYSRKYISSAIFKTLGVFYGSSFPMMYNISIVLEK